MLSVASSQPASNRAFSTSEVREGMPVSTKVKSCSCSHVGLVFIRIVLRFVALCHPGPVGAKIHFAPDVARVILGVAWCRPNADDAAFPSSLGAVNTTP